MILNKQNILKNYLFSEHFFKNINTLKNIDVCLLYNIRTLLGEHGKTYFEIGSFDGSSAILMLLHKFETSVYANDLFEYTSSNVQEYILNIKKCNIFKNKFHVYHGPSTHPDIINKFTNENIKLDMLFIDSDQTYFSILDNWNVYSKIINPGGVVIFNDYNNIIYCPEIKPAVDHIVKSLDKAKYNVVGELHSLFIIQFLDDSSR